MKTITTSGILAHTDRGRRIVRDLRRLPDALLLVRARALGWLLDFNMWLIEAELRARDSIVGEVRG